MYFLLNIKSIVALEPRLGRSTDPDGSNVTGEQLTLGAKLKKKKEAKHFEFKLIESTSSVSIFRSTTAGVRFEKRDTLAWEIS